MIAHIRRIALTRAAICVDACFVEMPVHAVRRLDFDVFDLMCFAICDVVACSVIS